MGVQLARMDWSTGSMLVQMRNDKRAIREDWEEDKS